MWLTDNCLDVMRDLDPGSIDLVIADPTYGESDLINTAILESERLCKARIFFMYAEDLCSLDVSTKPDQVCFWSKPVSTKNTSRRYSRFIEVICVWHGDYFNADLPWHNRTGVFTDTLLESSPHPWKKPPSLIERLIRLHLAPPYEGKTVLDPFAGSGTVADVCEKLGIECISIEKDPAWARK